MEAHCIPYTELMDEALDAYLDHGTAPPEDLRRHLSTCEDCGRAWSAIASLHGLLKAQPPVAVPANFSNRTMARLAAWTLNRPAWQLALLQLAALLSGVAMVVAVLALVRAGQGQPMPAPLWTAAVDQLLRSALSIGGTVVATLVESRWIALSYPFIAVMLAAIWFLALFGPRLLFKPGRGGL